jgi:DNA-binding MarR family transcriptional regulator
VGATTMSVIVANLERDGAVSRRPHSDHGRIQVIEITESGRKLLARCKSAVYATEETLLAGVSSTDEKVIRRWLAMVALLADQIDSSGSALDTTHAGRPKASH